MTDAKDAGSVRDLTNGVPFVDLPDGGMVAGRVGADDVLLARRGMRSLPSAPTARTTTGRSWTV